MSQTTHTKRSLFIFICSFASLLVVGIPLIGSVLFHPLTPNAYVFVFFVLALFDFCICYAINICWFKPVQLTSKHTSTPRNLAIILVICVGAAFILEALTVFGTPQASLLNLWNWNKLRILIFFVCSFMFFMLLILYRQYFPHTNKPKNPEFFFSKRKALVCAGSTLGGIVIGLIYANIGSRSLFLCALFAGILAGLIAFLIVCRKLMLHKPHWGFLAVVLALGTCFIISQPTDTWVSWDDETHYPRALALSYVSGASISEADWEMIHHVESEHVNTIAVVSENTITSYYERLNTTFGEGGVTTLNHFEIPDSSSTLLSVTTIGYIPSAFGLWLGRLLHLPFNAIFVLGKWMNLLAFALICTLAIAIVPRKKPLMLSIALLPVCMFLASNYAYDPWVISFLLLACAFVVREICSEDKLDSRFWALALICFALGLAPKAIYFPVLGIMFLMPQHKFRDKKQRNRYYASIVIIGLLAVVSFLAPYLASSGGGSGDARGGTEVNASAQTAFVLSSPFAYARILAQFLFGTYLTPESMGLMATSFAYLGSPCVILPFLVFISPCLILATTFLSSSVYKKATRAIGGTVWVVFIFFVTVSLVATALYISYTPVGLQTINGCQGRYIIPLLFPLLAFIGNPFPITPKVENITSYVLIIFSTVWLGWFTWALSISQIYV